MNFMRIIQLGLALGVATMLSVQAHVGTHPSVHDTVQGITDRLAKTLTDAELRQLDAAQVLARLTPGEREILGTQHLLFRVNTAVTVTVLSDTALTGGPFWLADQGFRRTPETVERGTLKFEAWEQSFPAGEVGLGVNSLTGGGEHYLVLVKPRDLADPLIIDELYPGQLRLADFVNGVRPYVDREEQLETIPAGLLGRKLIQTRRANRDDGRVVGVFRWTEHPATAAPDQIVLTWSGDPRHTQAIQWRTHPHVRRGYVQYGRRQDLYTVHPRNPKRVKAITVPLADPLLVNDPFIHRHTVELTGLDPGTSYLYAVGDGSRRGWSEWREFKTAPATTAPFSFIYMGDAQNGLDRWGSLVRNAYRERPDAAFYLMAGDLVNRGNQRDDWDHFFANARDVFDRRTVVPVIGNHECQGGHPTLYLQQFALPRSGPASIEPERVYAFEYGNAFFAVLDSNLSPTGQVEWLDQQLASTQARWKFVTHHHPAYSSTPGRDNQAVRQVWTPIYDKHHVDLVLQGHDHAYLRTHPLKSEARVKSTAEGTVYVVSVSGTKMYPQAARDYTAVGLTNVPTYQVLDIQVSDDRLLYRAYDVDGALRDELVIEKR